ncbi:hypothetical protein [Mycolicibacter minnesotensis]
MPTVTGWWEEVHARFALALAPEVAMPVLRSAGLSLTVSPGVGMAPFGRAGVSAASITVGLAPGFQIAAGGSSVADVGLSVAPSVAMGAAERYVRAVEVAAVLGVGMVGAERYVAVAGLALLVELGMDTVRRANLSVLLGFGADGYGLAGVSAADVDVAVSPGVGAVGAGTSVAACDLSVTPAFGVVIREGVATASSGLSVTLAVGAVGGERYARAAGLSVSPSCGATGSERYARAADLSVTIGVGPAATGTSGDAAMLSVTPVVGAVGRERYARAAGLSVSPVVGAGVAPSVVQAGAAVTAFRAVAPSGTDVPNGHASRFRYVGVEDAVVVTRLFVRPFSGAGGTMQFSVAVAGYPDPVTTAAVTIPASGSQVHIDLPSPVIVPRNTDCTITMILGSSLTSFGQMFSANADFEFGGAAFVDPRGLLAAFAWGPIPAGLSVSPVLGASRGQGVARADVGLSVTPGLAMAGAERYARAASQSVTPGITASGTERYTHTAVLPVTLTLGTSAIGTSRGGAALSAAPALTATGTERYARAAEAVVTPTLTVGGDAVPHVTAELTVTPLLRPYVIESDSPSPYPSEFDYPFETDYPFDP